MNEDLHELYQDVILEHNRRPRNNREMTDATCSAEGYNPTCGDDVKVFVKLDGNIIIDVSFSGEGCAISQASASLMTELISGKSISEARTIVDKICRTLSGSNLGDSGVDSLQEYGEVVALCGVKNFPMRIKCATLVWHALNDALKNY